MAKDNKFGMFGGVFTPSILTILGVIMYLRLPWVVGNAGLYAALGIVAVAHVISVCTGLSISSIATDKNVGAGGPYYIVSRSLGLPIGGTLGLALFLGLAFSISLYVIGFSESFLGTLHISATPTAIRICGTITIAALTVVTLISTALAIKTQYLILTLIGLSLVSVFLGHPAAAAAASAPHLKPAANGASMAVVFGVFFPAVTGFTAGVNMSGDLQNPKASIPKGTLLAIGVGLIVYVCLSIFLAYRVSPKLLLGDTQILQKVALYGPLVVAGIWGATLSSALGSILGAPRILQAVSVDRITPRFFARGHGKANEPRNALLLAFAIGETGILIAELDAIARIVSMVFLATYGFLNLSCAIESWASPDFRPSFRIPKSVSVIGAVTCLLVMIQLDLLAMFGATALMAGLFAYLKRRQLKLDSGDTWEGIWSSLVRSGLYRLSRETSQQRNWRPNILMFSSGDGASRTALRGFAAALISGNGILTDFDLVEPARRSTPAADEEEPAEEERVGVFNQRLPTDDPYDAIENVCRYHGFAGLEPNTVFMDWAGVRRDEARYSALLDSLGELDFNVLLFSRRSDAATPTKPRIDIWWRQEAGNLPLSLSLVRFITSDSPWNEATLRFVLLSDDSANNDYLRTTTRRFLRSSRVEAAIRVVNPGPDDEGFEDRVREESTDAALTILGLPEHGGSDIDEQAQIARLMQALPATLLMRASSQFEEVLSPSRPAAISFLPPVEADGQPAELTVLDLPEAPDLSRLASSMAERLQALAGSFHEQCLARVYAEDIKLVRQVKSVMERHFGLLEKGLSGANPRRQHNVVNRVQSSFLMDCQELLGEFENKVLPDQQSVLEGRIEAFLEDETIIEPDQQEVVVQRNAADFRADKDDSAYIRGFKRRRRLVAWLKRTPITYPIPRAALGRWYFERAVKELLSEHLRGYLTDSHQLAVRLGKLLNSSRTSLTLIGNQVAGEEELAQFLAEQKRRTLEHLEELVTREKQRVARHQWSALVTARTLAQAFTDDILRLDVRPLAQRERKVKKDAEALHDELGELPDQWLENQKLLVQRARLGLVVSSFQHRFATLAQREKEAMLLSIKNGALSECETVDKKLVSFMEALASNGAADAKRLKLHLDTSVRFDEKPFVETLLRETNETIAELPESTNTLSDESVQALEEGRIDDVEQVELPVRRLVQFLVESEFLGELGEELAPTPQAEQRALGVAQDVVRLVTFHQTEFESLGGGGAEAFREHMTPVVENGRERLDTELAKLRGIGPALSQKIDDQLTLVLDRTNAYDLTSTSANLEQHIRLHQGRKAVSGARWWVRRAIVSVKEGMVALLYRRSAGVVYARTIKGSASTRSAVVDRVLSFVNKNTPKPDVVDALPFYYRQLFFGQSGINEAFWVGRRAELARARRAVDAFRRGKRGALVVTGERGSGKTALCQRITSDLDDRFNVYRVHAPAGGSADPAAFQRALQEATGLGSGYEELFRELPEPSAIVIDDLELWWERTADGLAVVDLILDLIEFHGHRCLFILTASTQSYAFISRLRPLPDRALAVLECGPLSAEALKSIVTLRHASTGMKFELGSKGEDQLTEWGRARLFSRHFDYSGGVVGAALRSWITHVERVGEDSLGIRIPTPPDASVLDDLKPGWVALLLQLMLHKQLTVSRLARISGLPADVVGSELDTLVRMGLVLESGQRLVETNRFVQHIIAERFRKRGLGL